MAFESSFKAIDNTLHHDDGCSTALDYVEQSSWVLFFTKGEPTQKIWYYQVDKHFTKTQPMTEADLADFLAKQKTREDSEYSWTIDVANLGDDLDLSVKNPHKVEEVDERTPGEVYSSLMALEDKAAETMEELSWALWPEDEDEENPLFGELLVESDEEDEA